MPLTLSAQGADVVTATTGNFASVAGFYGVTQSNSGFGVHGHSNNTNTDGYLGGNDYGVYGVATDASGNGVMGQAGSGKGVYGQSSSGDGIYGQTNGELSSGVHGHNNYANTDGYLGHAYAGVVGMSDNGGVAIEGVGSGTGVGV